MRILIAEDDRITTRLLQTVLEKAGHETVLTQSGDAALLAITGDDAPSMAILDWMMPGKDGPQVAREIRQMELSVVPYLILLTARSQREDLLEGFAAGVDDYIVKPFAREELLARIRVGERVLELQQTLRARVQELEQAITEVKQLRGLIPMCASCKRIRDDEGFWEEVEGYVMRHSEASFSHGLCPECAAELYPEYERIKKEKEAADENES